MFASREDIASAIGFNRTENTSEFATIDEVECDGFVRSRISHSVPDGDRVEAFLLRPLGSVRGAVVALHQHNSQWSLGKSEVAGIEGDPHQAFGPRLAAAGLSVLIPDILAFESRLAADASGAALAPPSRRAGSTAEGWVQHYNQMAYRIIRGETLLAKVVRDTCSAVDVLQSVVPVGQPIGVVGHSYGGIVALFAAALDERLGFCVSSGAVCSYEYKLANAIALEMSLIVPGVVGRFDFDSVLAALAPRPALIVSSNNDPFSADAEDVVAKAMPAYRSVDASDRLSSLRSGDGHALDETRFNAIVEWIEKQA